MKEEHELVQRAKGGEMSAFRELVEHHKKKIYYLAYDLSGNHYDAEDLSQEVFIRAFRSLKNFRGDASWSSYLYRITVNVAISHNRKKSVARLLLSNNLEEDHQTEIESGDGESIQNPESSAGASLMQRHLANALGKLSSRERSIFVLRHYHDLPLKEIAQSLQINLGTVKSLLFRALKKLQKELAFYKEEVG